MNCCKLRANCIGLQRLDSYEKNKKGKDGSFLGGHFPLPFLSAILNMVSSTFGQVTVKPGRKGKGDGKFFKKSAWCLVDADSNREPSVLQQDNVVLHQRNIIADTEANLPMQWEQESYFPFIC